MSPVFVLSPNVIMKSSVVLSRQAATCSRPDRIPLWRMNSDRTKFHIKDCQSAVTVKLLDT